MASYSSVGLPIPRPMPLNCRNRKSRWKEFKAEFNDYAISTDLYKETEEKQMTAFRLYLGAHWRSKLRMLSLPALKPAENGKAAPLLIATAEALDKEFGSSQNVLLLRERFHKFSQGELDIETYLDRLYELASECEFPADFRDEMIRDRIVFGIQNQATKDRLMSAEKIDLNTVLSTVRRLVESNRRSTEDEETSISVNSIRRRSDRRQSGATNRECAFCGFSHARDRKKCPASGQTCDNCSKKGHFKKMCKSGRGKKIHRVGFESENDDSTTENDDDRYSLESAYAVRGESNGRFKSIKIPLTAETGKKPFPLELQIDTGASCSILPLYMYEKLLREKSVGPLEKSKVLLKMYNGDTSKSRGRCSIICLYGTRRTTVRFEVAQTTEPPLLSAYVSWKLGIVRLGSGVEFVHGVRAQSTSQSQTARLRGLIKKHETVFNGLGKLPGTVSIHLKDGCKPVQCLPRRVPISIKDQVVERILDLEKLGVIERLQHDRPSAWISQMLVVTREGKKPRITLDPFHLNQATKRCHFRMPTLSDILPHLSKAKIFTVCDAADGFYQCVLDAESTDCTAFWTPLGRFKYLRMPQGLNIAPEIYQAKQIEVLEGLNGVYCVADDLLITGSGESNEEAWDDHHRNLEAFLIRCGERGLKLNRTKLRLATNKVKFLGHILTPQGVKCDPEKIETIKRMLPPKDKTSLQRFLGAVNYHHAFIKDLSTHTAPLRALLKNDVEFAWGHRENSAFEKLKGMLCSENVLAYYNPRKPVLIRTDASQHSVGAVLLQNGKPVDYCSAALRQAEKNYAVIEKELLAILIACEKFEHYIIHHQDVTVETDQQPLMSIFRKPLYDAPKRLQRMLSRLQKFHLKVCYTSGKQNTVADWLSRDAPETTRTDKDSNIQEFVFRTKAEQVDVDRLSQVSNKTLHRIKEAAREDNEFISLKHVIETGWPRTRELCTTTLKPFWKYKSELVHANGLIYKGSAIYIPQSLREDMLRTSHLSHYGFRLLWRRARDCVFWPAMKSQLEDFCNNCEACLSFQSKQQKQPMMKTTTATYPFQVVFQDLFEFRGKQYLVTVDVFSDFFEVDNLGETATSRKLIQVAKKHFSRYGIPVELHSDNGPQFSSAEFEEFMDSWKITHITSSPYFAQSNGKAEAAVKIAKRLLKKCTLNEEDYEYGLLETRNVPQPEGVSRAQKFFGRHTRTKLPSVPDQNWVSDKTQYATNRRKAIKRKQHYDKTARPLKQLRRGDIVRVEPRERIGTWKEGIYHNKVGPRSYIVKLSDGTLIRRNRRHLKLSKESPRPPNNSANEQETPTRQRIEQVHPRTAENSLLRPSKLTINTPVLDMAANELRRGTRERKATVRYQHQV